MNKPKSGETLPDYIKRIIDETNNGYPIQQIINNYKKFR